LSQEKGRRIDVRRLILQCGLSVFRSANNCSHSFAQLGGTCRGEQDLDSRVVELAEAPRRFQNLRGCGASKTPYPLERRKPNQPREQDFVLEIWFGIWELPI
jgi:hypothetical protein